MSTPGFVTAGTAALNAFDYYCIDVQHGVVDYADAAVMIEAVNASGGTPIVRAPWNEAGIVGKLLDAGAHGVIAPMVNTREHAEALVRAVRYAPDGARSWGPILAARRRPDYLDWARANIAVIPMIETTQALENLDEIVSTPGIDAVYVGPADLSLTLGLPPGNNDGEAAFDDALAAIVAACQRHGVVPGIHSTGALAPRRREQGFRMVTVTSDQLAMNIGLKSELATARGDASAAAGDAMY